MKLAVVGVTGLVGQKMLAVLNEFNFPIDKLIPVASARSAGQTVHFRGEDYKVVEPEQAVLLQPDLALFSAGGSVSKEYAPKFAEAGCKVIDNSSAWRMHDGIKLIVPEINAHLLKYSDMIIANPNCSTIQMVVALAPLHKLYRIERIVISTYQSVTGTGKYAVDQLNNERNGTVAEAVYPHPIDKNCLPHCDNFLENGYTREEMKLVNETRKIFDDQVMGISATAVRVPVTGGHAESVNVTFNHDFDLSSVRKTLNNSQGIIVDDDPQANSYPMPLYSEGRNEVFVGRIRRDESFPRTLNMWIVADNLRKGAATNAVQIAAYLYKNKLI